MPDTKLFLPLSPRHLLFACVGYRLPQRGTTLSLTEAAFIWTMILNGANRYVFATDIQDIDEIKSRTVSRDLFDADAKLWAGRTLCEHLTGFSWHRQVMR